MGLTVCIDTHISNELHEKKIMINIAIKIIMVEGNPIFIRSKAQESD